MFVHHRNPEVDEMSELKGKVSIVTGAAQGMGRAIVERFAEEGSTPVMVDLQKEKLLGLASELKKKEIDAMVQVCDVSDEGSVRMMVDAVMEEYGRIDILINCAGIMYPTRFYEMTVEEWDRVMAVNLRGVFLTMREIFPHMKAKGDGRIVNFSSTAGKTVSTLGGAHYTASKHGVIGLTRAVAKEGGPIGIRVNAVCPGLIDTDMVRGTIDEETLRRFGGSFPINRLGTSREVAELVLFLASDRSAYITGAAVNISGGDLLA
jgi:NAD(P)-dependent dehydrogenase (short-subunit alcohol dehydrogenase family)